MSKGNTIPDIIGEHLSKWRAIMLVRGDGPYICHHMEPINAAHPFGSHYGLFSVCTY
jgi:hypothetical protein